MLKEHSWEDAIREEAKELVNELSEGELSQKAINEFIDLAMIIKFIPDGILRESFRTHFLKLFSRGYDSSFQTRIFELLCHDGRYDRKVFCHYSKQIPGVLVLAPPGAGKSYLCKEMNKKYPYDVIFDLDNVVHNYKDKWYVDSHVIKTMIHLYPILIGFPANWKELLQFVDYAAYLDVDASTIRVNLLKRKAVNDDVYINKIDSYLNELKGILKPVSIDELYQWINFVNNAIDNCGPLSFEVS